MRMRANKNRNFPRFLISGNKSGMVEIKKSIGKTKTRSRLGSATSPTHRFPHVKKVRLRNSVPFQPLNARTVVRETHTRI